MLKLCFVLCCVLLLVIIHHIDHVLSRLILKTKNTRIPERIYGCLISKETSDYISIDDDEDSGVLFVFPGLNSESTHLHEICQDLYIKCKKSVFIFKYNSCYKTVQDISTYLISIIPSKYLLSKNINVIGISYGCSIAIDTCLKLQENNLIDKIDVFICHKTFTDIRIVFKYQSTWILKVLSKMIMWLSINDYVYSNRKVLELDVDKIVCINHTEDEVIPAKARFSSKFCNDNDILLIEDKIDHKYGNLFNRYFGNHSYFCIDMIKDTI